MSVPELCRNFSAVAWCGKLNAIACASETCARIPSSNANPPFWIPIHIVIPERPTECAVFNVIAEVVEFLLQILLVTLFSSLNGPLLLAHGPANLVRDASCWQREHEWRQDIAVVTKWLSGVSLIGGFHQNPAVPQIQSQHLRKNSFHINLKLQWPPSQSNATPKWFCTSKGLLGAGPSGIMAADAIVTDSGAMHVAGVPIVNPSTIVVWEVTPGPGPGFQATPKTSTSTGLPPSLNPPNWSGFAPLAAYLFSWQEYLISEAKQEKKHTDQDFSDTVSLHCSPVSNFSAYVSPEAAAQSAATTTWGSGVTAVAFDPTRGGSVIAVVIVEGQYMSPYDPDEGPSITGWRVQRWESSLQPVVLHQIFGNPTSSLCGRHPCKLYGYPKWIQAYLQQMILKIIKRLQQGPFLMPERHLILVLRRQKVSLLIPLICQVMLDHLLELFILLMVTAIRLMLDLQLPLLLSLPQAAALLLFWHDTSKDRTMKIIRVLPPAVPNSQVKANSSTWERAIAERFWWSLLVGVDWWDAVGCTQSAAEDNIVSLNSVIAVLDADFHSLPSNSASAASLDRIKCRLLEVPEPWLASGDKLSGIDPEAMAVEPTLVPSIQAYVDAILDLASHFITRLRRYASFCRTLASHAVTAGTGSNRSMVTSPTQSSASPATSQGGQNGTASSTGSTQMQAWVQGAIAKISSASDGVSNSTPNPITGPSSFMPISINTGTFPGTPAVRLIGDCHFLHRLCQLLLFCFFFRRTQLPRFIGGAQKNTDTNMQKPQSAPPAKVEESNSVSSKPAPTMVRSDEGQAAGGGQLVPGAKGVEDGPAGRSRLGYGNAGQGYTFEEVKVLFLILMDLCRRTVALAHPLPVSQVGSSSIQVRLHYIDGNYTVLPEVVEASLGPHMQNMPRPRGADAAGLLLRELELHPPSEEWHRRNMFGGPWSDPEDMGSADDTPRMSSYTDSLDFSSSEIVMFIMGLMAYGKEAQNCGKTGLEGVWYKCIRCLRQTSAFASSGSANSPNQNVREAWWISRWAYGCPMCGGTWVRVV
ncbi:hypothetical protein GH714_002106 [Hevea brasiliensis]|uniref:Mediator of RNA polymerase II transcription subunit 16 n=1 Tax=Hevea brasiliensis TaxID=3981 RepID=A0A6A6LUL6_HEVBR|nr:hypothetical protein GH714_002106 [Hevea brasiliensis]